MGGAVNSSAHRVLAACCAQIAAERDGAPIRLNVPGTSVGVDSDGVEWFRMSPDWVWGNAASRAWALALKRHQAKAAKGQ